ncbi:ATP-binding protein [Naasia sp. SYSU D00057]|uniref:sensor histidine kinase n=1 Tax=Naasia sp. SYSU D00057 TaxID=2817380 RepID=UPI001B3017BC|nr:ATP-binding protein [Naasia sp. SYSU D00057]
MSQGRGVPRLPPIPAPGLGRTRVAIGLALAALVPPSLELVLLAVPEASLATAALVQVAGAVLVAVVGGLVPALVAAVLATLLLNYFRTEPTGTLLVADAHALIALVLYVAVAGTVALVVDVSARRYAKAKRAGAEAAALRELALTAVAAEDPVQALLDQAREVLRLDGVGLFVRSAPSSSDDGWTLAASAGAAPATPSAGTTISQVDADTLLALAGRPLPPGETRLLGAFAAQVTAARTRQRLAATERENRQLAEDNRMRTSILRAVSHDLRTPLAGIRLSVDGLLQPGADFTEGERRELLATTSEYADRLTGLVENLLDMSRISSDAVRPSSVEVEWAAVVARALAGIPAGSVAVELGGGDAVLADPGLAERVVANLAENAVRHAPGARIVVRSAVVPAPEGTATGELRVIDTGGAPLPADLEDLFRPFQRRTDSGAPAGVGLGLAVARGLAEAMGGTLVAERTPGGGLTMVLRLPLAEAVRAAASGKSAGA